MSAAEIWLSRAWCPSVVPNKVHRTSEVHTKRCTPYIGGTKRCRPYIGGTKRCTPYIGGNKRCTPYIGVPNDVHLKSEVPNDVLLTSMWFATTELACFRCLWITALLGGEPCGLRLQSWLVLGVYGLPHCLGQNHEVYDYRVGLF